MTRSGLFCARASISKRLRLAAAASVAVGALVFPANVARANALISNGDFESGNLAGWTASGDGIAGVVQEGTCFSGLDVKNLQFPGQFSGSVRSNGPGDVGTVGILTSDAFTAGNEVSFQGLSESTDGFSNPSTLTVKILKASDDSVLLTRVVAPNVVDLPFGCNGNGAIGTFSEHSINTATFSGMSVKIQFAQHTNVQGFGFSTFIDEVRSGSDTHRAILVPSALNFGFTRVGSPSTKTLTVTNSGSLSLAIGTISLGGPNAADFAISSDGCSATSLTDGATCSLNVALTAGAVGERSASLSIPSDAPTSPSSVALSGIGDDQAPLSEVTFCVVLTCDAAPVTVELFGVDGVSRDDRAGIAGVTLEFFPPLAGPTEAILTSCTSDRKECSWFGGVPTGVWLVRAFATDRAGHVELPGVLIAVANT